MPRQTLYLLLATLAAVVLMVSLLAWPDGKDSNWPLMWSKSTKQTTAAVEEPAEEPEQVTPDVAPPVVVEPIVPPKPKRSWKLEFDVIPEPAPEEVLAISVVPHNPGEEPDPLEPAQEARYRDGKWIVDVTSIFKRPKQERPRLRVEVRRRGYLTRVEDVKSTSIKWIREGEQGAKQAHSVYRVRLLRSSTVCGLAVNEKGEAVDNARIWIIPAKRERGSFEPLDHVLTDGTGSFCLEVPFDNKWIAVGMKDGYRPLTLPLSTSEDDSNVVLKFKRGETLEVQVRFGEDPAPGLAVSIWNNGRKPSRFGRREAFLGEDSVCWEGDHVERLSVKGRVDDEGVLRFSGLDRSTYTVVTGRLGCSPCTAYSFFGQETDRRVTLPAKSPTVFQFDVARIDVKLVGGQAPNCMVAITEKGERRQEVSTEEGNTCTFYVNPAKSYTVEASTASRVWETDVRTAEAGSVTEVELRCGGG